MRGVRGVGSAHTVLPDQRCVDVHGCLFVCAGAEYLKSNGWLDARSNLLVNLPAREFDVWAPHLRSLLMTARAPHMGVAILAMDSVMRVSFAEHVFSAAFVSQSIEFIEKEILACKAKHSCL
eukprot:m.36405 g.36405  ORF g.36405 m.36405 type:complete len:122 (-) comp44616_c0_seq2:237-602(-)